MKKAIAATALIAGLLLTGAESPNVLVTGIAGLGLLVLGLAILARRGS